MRRRIPLGRILGVRLFLHPSWFLVFGLVTWATSTTFGDVYPGLASAERLSMGLATGLAFFACLAAHELAHSVVARRFGVRIRGITLFAFGGMAEIDGELPTPARELAVASAGPATSIAIGGLFGLASAGAASIGWGAGQGVCTTLAVVNLGVAAFNLVPGLPLDGGRLLRAGIWRLTGSHRSPRASRPRAGWSLRSPWPRSGWRWP
jgi:Zn-dependent protease